MTTSPTTFYIGQCKIIERPPKTKPPNPILLAIQSWQSALPKEQLVLLNVLIDDLLLAAPRRWTVYPPMVLLPSGSFRNSPFWTREESALSPEEREARNELWKGILREVGRREGKGMLKHLAVSAGIPLHGGSAALISAEEERKEPSAKRRENVLRTPSGLIMLYGDFGPGLDPSHTPTEQDFGQAFWVSTKQNGITQIWAPRYTMFSRGNVKEKARLLNFHNSGDGNRTMETSQLAREMAVDLYGGIGYFVFSYVMMGMGRVLGWEINPWSVEGLRRGAMANGWSIRVVNQGEEWEGGSERIVVFLEHNVRAAARLEAVGELGPVRHVNCGLLPTSEASWRMALSLLDGSGWLHLHENVGVEDVEARKADIEEMFRKWLSEDGGENNVGVDHVEFVKTFAPGVWHCVFDVYVSMQHSQI